LTNGRNKNSVFKKMNCGDQNCRELDHLKQKMEMDLVK